MARPHLLDALRDRVLLCDGGMGSRVQALTLDIEKDYWGRENCTDVLVLSRPDLVREIHRGYYEAGAYGIQGPAAAFVRGDLAAVAHRLFEIFGHRHARERVLGQVDQFLAEILQGMRLALALGFARAFVGKLAVGDTVKALNVRHGRYCSAARGVQIVTRPVHDGAQLALRWRFLISH